jgi:hypothetical protein
MRKNIKKLKATKKKTINNTSEKDGGVRFTKNGTKVKERHQKRLLNTRKSTRTKTINNTTKKERGGLIH